MCPICDTEELWAFVVQEVENIEGSSQATGFLINFMLYESESYDTDSELNPLWPSVLNSCDSLMTLNVKVVSKSFTMVLCHCQLHVLESLS
jgi:hypothetical protein